jgi:hypothetical protein
MHINNNFFIKILTYSSNHILELRFAPYFRCHWILYIQYKHIEKSSLYWRKCVNYKGVFCNYIIIKSLPVISEESFASPPRI